MRIISNFKDYYDNATKAFTYEIDPKLVYVREKQVIENIEENKLIKPFISRFEESKQFYNHWNWEFSNPFVFIVIGFCGKLYHAYQLQLNNCNCYTKKFMYSFEDVYSYFKTDGTFVNDYTIYFESFKPKERPKNIDLVIENERNKFVKTLDNCYIAYSKGSKHKLIKSFDELDKLNGQTISDDVFIHYNSPVLMLAKSKKFGNDIELTINPNLSFYNFASKVDPFTAFQEISMYLGNNLAKQIDPTTNFTDEMKRDIAGFDNWSFKKPGKNSKL